VPANDQRLQAARSFARCSTSAIDDVTFRSADDPPSLQRAPRLDGVRDTHLAAPEDSGALLALAQQRSVRVD
jgi:hypothetical protein